MPFGYACRQRIVKQVPHKPTVRTGLISREIPTPGPNSYEQPAIYCGSGFSKIKRAPAYSFGQLLKPVNIPAVSANAPLLNLYGTDHKKGVRKIPGGLMERHWRYGSKFKVPGPGTHDPLLRVTVKRAPAYTMQLAAKPPYEPYDMWTPSPNMYWPDIPKKNPPAYTFSDKALILKPFETPAPWEHEPNYKYTKKKEPEYSLGPGHRPTPAPLATPAPNAYCEKKFLINKPSVPAPSFGIKHSPYLGQSRACMKPSNIELRSSQA